MYDFPFFLVPKYVNSLSTGEKKDIANNKYAPNFIKVMFAEYINSDQFEPCIPKNVDPQKFEKFINDVVIPKNHLGIGWKWMLKQDDYHSIKSRILAWISRGLSDDEIEERVPSSIQNIKKLREFHQQCEEEL